MAELKSKHAFGSEANIDTALANGTIDAYDILFLNEGKIGWITKDGKKVILEDKSYVVSVDTLPETGDAETIYIYNSKFYYWNGTEFVASSSEGSVDETTMNEKVAAAVAEANAYTDEKVASITSNDIIEF